jgi:hypothetical protein
MSSCQQMMLSTREKCAARHDVATDLQVCVPTN